MALVSKLERAGMERPRKHDEVECTYTVFETPDGQNYLQLNTFGSKDRLLKGKQSQTIQFDAQAVRQLRKIFDREFG